MFLNSLAFQAMEKSMESLWLKTRMVSNNISNYETPGYKSKQVTFEEILGANKKDVVGFKTNLSISNDTSVRVDGNNVNMEKEQLELWRTYAQTSYLNQKISGEINNIRYVIKQAAK